MKYKHVMGKVHFWIHLDIDVHIMEDWFGEGEGFSLTHPTFFFTF